MQAYTLATSSLSYASQAQAQPASSISISATSPAPTTAHTHALAPTTAPSPVPSTVPAPSPTSARAPIQLIAPSPQPKVLPKTVTVKPKLAPAAIAPALGPQPATSTSSTAVDSALKLRAVTVPKSSTRQIQEDDDDEDDEDDDDDDVDDSHLAPSERHLRSFIGHWQGWCRGRRYKDKFYITPQKVMAYVKSMISPGFQLDRLNPPLHISAFNGETERYLPSWTTVHMNILSIQVLYMRQCEKERTSPDVTNLMNHRGLKSSQFMDPTSKFILDPRLFQPRIDPPSSSSPPHETSNAISPSLLPHPMPYSNDIEQSNSAIRLVNGNGNSSQPIASQNSNGQPIINQSNSGQSIIGQGNIVQGNVVLSNITHSAAPQSDIHHNNVGQSKKSPVNNGYRTSGPFNPPNSNSQYCMHTALASIEMEMFMSSLRTDIMAAVNRSVEHSLVTRSAVEILGGRMDKMELAARQSMADVVDTELTEEDLRDMELYHKRRAIQLRQSRLDKKKVKSTGAHKKTDRQLREEREKRQDKNAKSSSFPTRLSRSRSADAHHHEGHYNGEDDNDGDEDQFYDMLPEDEMIDNHIYKSEPDAEEDREDMSSSDSEDFRTREPVTLDENAYDILPRKNATRRSIVGGTKNTAVTPQCDLFQTKELNVLADDIAGHYKQIEEKKTKENFDEELLLPRNAGLLELWMEMFSAQEKQPSIWGMNVYANGWHLLLEMKVKQRVALKRKIIQSVLSKIQTEMEYIEGDSVPSARTPSLKEMVKSALIAVELEIQRDGSINAYHDRIKRRGNQ
ncbi:hypothetical protein BGX24_005653 [Mortierella sp. AD032]|nr:hypothetical protein BGX24_005653 [Mortierella sp. AD032]